ncbi:MAG: hypothetical protein K2Y51_06340 [Gammaproteobacteria bacterium]|nr:hypothetical protein [Gammaproteobacteria bacterium]
MESTVQVAGPGWLEFVVQGGALALLAVVVVVFFRNVLPAFLGALREQQSAFLSTLAARDTHHERVITTIANDHKEAIDKLADTLERHTAELVRSRTVERRAAG